jgi:hypothetical protein
VGLRGWAHAGDCRFRSGSSTVNARTWGRRPQRDSLLAVERDTCFSTREQLLACSPTLLSFTRFGKPDARPRRLAPQIPPGKRESAIRHTLAPRRPPPAPYLRGAVSERKSTTAFVRGYVRRISCGVPEFLRLGRAADQPPCWCMGSCPRSYGPRGESRFRSIRIRASPTRNRQTYGRGGSGASGLEAAHFGRGSRNESK